MVEVIEGLEAATVLVRDIERSRKFYRDVLGLREVSFLPKASRAALALPGIGALLTMHVQGPDEWGLESGTISGVVFAHQSRPRRRVRGDRAPRRAIVDPPHTFTAATGTVTLGVVADPDGNPFVVRHVRP